MPCIRKNLCYNHSMIELTRKDDLVSLMLSSAVNLSTYDTRFMYNLQKSIANNTPITSNQVELFDHLISKYKRQLASLGYDKNVLKTLPWSLRVINSDTKYTDANIFIENGMIYFRAPFNKGFLGAFRSSDNNNFKWNKNEKRFEAKYDTQSLRLIYDLAPKHYATVNHCPIVIELLNSLRQYDAVKYWDPTLVNVTGHLMIASSNESLDNALATVKLELLPRTLLLLSNLGVNIEPAILEDDERLLFSSTLKSEVDSKKLDEALDWLVELGCKRILFVGQPPSKQDRQVLFQKMSDRNLEYSPLSAHHITDTTEAQNPVTAVLQYISLANLSGATTWLTNHPQRRILNIIKIVKVLNTEGIDLKYRP